MPLSNERMEELRQLHAASRGAAKPVVLSNEPDWLTQLAPDSPPATGLTPERMEELRQLHASQKESMQKQAPQSEQITVGEDVLKSIGGGIVRGAVAAPMVVGNILNEAVAGPQLLGVGIKDTILGNPTTKNPKIWKPFYSSEEVVQMLPEALRPHSPQTGYGTAADIAGQMVGGVGSSAAIMRSPQMLSAAKNSKIITDETSGGIGGTARLDAKVAKNEIKANRPVELYKDMLGNYKQIESTNNANFDNLSAISSKTEMVDVKPLQGGIKSIIKEIEDSPASPERANLAFFKRVEKTIDKGEKLPVSDVVDLNKFLNSRFNPKKVGSAEKLSEAQLNSQVKGILEGYGAKNPQWGETYKQAQGFFQNEVAPLKSDFVTKKGFDVNDAKIIERFNRGELKQLPDDLVERARALPSKVNDDVAYNRLAPLVSPEKQKDFGKLVIEGANPEGSKSHNYLTRALRTGAYGIGSIASGGSPYMRARFGAEVAGMVKGQDPLYPLIKKGVKPIGERIAPDVAKAQALAKQISQTPPAGQLALPAPTTNGLPRGSQAQGYVDALTQKRAQELAASNIGQERAAFEASQAKAADLARMSEQQNIMGADEALAACQAGVDPQTYVKFLEQQQPPVVSQQPVAPQPNVYYNPQDMARKALNEARGKGETPKNARFADEDIVAELMKLRLYGKK